jgi:hypothetical protein
MANYTNIKETVSMGHYYLKIERDETLTTYDFKEL